MYVTPMATLYFGSKVEKAIRDLRFISFSYSKKAVFGEGRDLPESSKKIKSHNFCTYYMLKICKWTNIDTLCLLNMTKSIYVVVKCSYLIFCWYNITLHNYSPCPVSRDHCVFLSPSTLNIFKKSLDSLKFWNKFQICK